MRGRVLLRLGSFLNRTRLASKDARRAIYHELTTIVAPLHILHLGGEPGFSAAFLREMVAVGQAAG